MAFDITSVFNMPSSGTQELATLDIGLIRPDPKNKDIYKIEGIEDLAANIELVGLQQPLQVRPDPEAEGQYIAVSGHRRLEALKLLVSEGKDGFAAVPCMVVENRSEAFNELRLIFGNANTRKLSDWELSQQAQRVQELFYRLKEEEGIEFPGRMRDHVAQACQVSKSKLSRLKVINEGLEVFVELWQGGKLPESVAYELAQCEKDLQWRIRDAKVKPEKLEAGKVKRVREAWDKGARWNIEFICTISGKVCGHGDVALRRDLSVASWTELCKGERCCLTCRYGADCGQSYNRCERMCKLAEDKVKAAKAKADEKAKAEEAKRTKKALAEFVATIQPYVAAMEAAGVDKIAFDYYGVKLEDLRLWLDEPEKCTNKFPMLEPRAKVLRAVADKLECSVDFLLGRTEVMAMAKADNPSVGCADSSLYTRDPVWQTGEPEKKGQYWCKLDFHDGLEPWVEDIVWTGEGWKGPYNTEDVIGWWPLPEG